MAILKAGRGNGSSNGSAPWLGIKPARIVEVRDESDKWDWAEIYLVVELAVEGSDYNRPLKIAGTFERSTDGTIQENSLVRRINYLCTALEWDGGINQHGKWEDENGEEVADIANFLHDNYANKGTDFNFLVYVYKEPPKNGKSYTRVHNKIMKNEGNNERRLEDHIAYLKKNGYLKEAKPEDSTVAEMQEIFGSDDNAVGDIQVENL